MSNVKDVENLRRMLVFSDRKTENGIKRLLVFLSERDSSQFWLSVRFGGYFGDTRKILGKLRSMRVVEKYTTKSGTFYRLAEVGKDWITQLGQEAINNQKWHDMCFTLFYCFILSLMLFGVALVYFSY